MRVPDLLITFSYICSQLIDFDNMRNTVRMKYKQI